MMISARNQLDVTVEAVRKGPVNALVTLKALRGMQMDASISVRSAEALQLQTGDRVIAFFKASHVLVATGRAISISARNKLEGVVESIRRGSINAEVALMLPGGERLMAIITNDAAVNLALKKGDAVVAIIKATDVMIAR